MTTEIRWSFPLWTSNLRESRFSRILENFFHISPLDLDLEAFSIHDHYHHLDFIVKLLVHHPIHDHLQAKICHFETFKQMKN